MIKQQFEKQQLNLLLEDFYSQKASGILTINVNPKTTLSKKSYFLVFNKGAITYASLSLLSNQKLAQYLLQKLNPNMSKVAIEIISKKTINPNSIQEFIDRLVKIRILTWEQVISFIQKEILQILEKIWQLSGDLDFDSRFNFDLEFGKNHHDFEWPQLRRKLFLRQKQWQAFQPSIPSVNGIPFVPINTLETIPNPSVREHLRKWVDGKRTLGDIAEQTNKDALVIAKSYFSWVQKDWIDFNPTRAAAKKNLPTILSVDDSPIVQTAIKRILDNRYNLLLASNAVNALNLLNQHQVTLLLLDLTMPDIDGLEVCKTLRAIPKFRDLPIIMLTARDGFVDKLKGKIAGTNRYLTKPFDEEKLLRVVREFIIFGNT